MTTNEKYLLVTKDIICYNQIEDGMMTSTVNGVIDEESATYDYQTIPRTRLLLFTENKSLYSLT